LSHTTAFRKVLSAALTLGLLWGLADPAASESPPGEPAASPPGPAARRVVESFHAVLVDGMKRSAELGFAGRQQQIAESLDETFDIPAIARDAILRGWKRLSEPDRARWVALVRQYWASRYAHEYRSFSGQSFETLDAAPATDEVVVVDTRFHQPGGSDVALEYRLLEVDGAWRVGDFHVGGKGSEVRRLRDSNYVVLEHGGFEALVADLNQQIEQLQRE